MPIPRDSATQSSLIRPPASRVSGRVSRSEATQEFQVKVLAYLRTNVCTLENWEQGRARPNAQAVILIHGHLA